MRRLYAVVTTILFGALVSQSVLALDVNKYLSGSWYNPQQTGHGFSVEILPDDRAVVYWYVYHPDGTPTFIVASGESSGSVVSADAYYNTGMRFGEFNPVDRVQSYWGTITLTFHTCDSATIQYNSVLEYEGVPYGSGSIPLTRLASIEGMQCSSHPVAGLYQGNFYSQTLNQIIPGLAAIAPNGEFAAISFDAMAGVGTWTSTGKNFSGTGTAVSADPGFSFSSSLTISGQYSTDYLLVGNYTVTGGDRGTFEFFALPELYRRGVSLSEIAGNYTAKNLVSGSTGSASLSSSGSLSGSDSLGCRYNGALTVFDPQFNLFQVTVTVSSCGISDGVYKGYGAQMDYYSLDDGRVLRLVGTDGRYAGVFDLYR